MANRPLFTPHSASISTKTHSVEFNWHPGLAASQKHKSVAELHQSAKQQGLCRRPLEISSKSLEPLGIALSAFNLQVPLGNGKHTYVENVFQAAKVFEHAGPFIDLLYVSPLEAKRDPRLKENGMLQYFHGNAGHRWPLQPTTLFSDWVYLNALVRNPQLCEQVMDYDGFTDIEFNPNKSLNCQAQSVALFISLTQAGLLRQALASPLAFTELTTKVWREISSAIPEQQSLL